MIKKLFLSLAFSVVSLFAVSEAQAADVYICNCGTGASGTCPTNQGTSGASGVDAAHAKQTLTEIQTAVNSAGIAGFSVKLCKGGAWTGTIFINNASTTATSRMTLTTYTPAGETAMPILQVTGASTVVSINDQTTSGNDDGGYTLDGLEIKCSGYNQGGWGVFIYKKVQHVTVQNGKLHDCELGAHVNNDFGGNQDIVFFNNEIYNNGQDGILGAASDFTVEWNNIHDNGSDTVNWGEGKTHGLYVGAASPNSITNVKVRFNNFTDNTVAIGTANAGLCTGGPMVVHGQITGAQIYGNFAKNTVGVSAGCYGISVKPDYTGQEWMRNFEIFGNKLINMGGKYIVLQSTQNARVFSNEMINTAGYSSTAICVGGTACSNNQEAADDESKNTYAMGNTYYQFAGSSGNTVWQWAPDTFTGVNTGNKFCGNLAYIVNGTSVNAYTVGTLVAGSFTYWGSNHFYRAAGTGSSTDPYSMSQLTSDPLFANTPSSGNNYDLSLTSSSPGIGTVSASNCNPYQTYDGRLRNSPTATGSRDYFAVDPGPLPTAPNYRGY